MALTNAQYDSLMREYNNKQMRNHQIVIQREEELYRAVPELSRLDDDVSRLSVESIDRLLNGDAACAFDGSRHACRLRKAER